MININYRDPRPIYEQVKDNFRQLIISGALPPDEKMPSVRELAASLTINPNTSAPTASWRPRATSAPSPAAAASSASRTPRSRRAARSCSRASTRWSASLRSSASGATS